jgi:penicillin-binding protein 2
MSTKRDLDRIFNRRALVLTGSGFVGFGAVALRVAQLQTVDLFSREYSEASDQNRFDLRVLAPPRGVIYDRFGVPLAITSSDLRVKIRRDDIGEDIVAITATISKVAAILGLDDRWITRRIDEVMRKPRYEAVILKQGLTWEEFTSINVRLPELRGISAEAGKVRRYPHAETFAHPIGYVQKPTDKDIERVLEEGSEGQRRAVYFRNPDVRVGKAGLEKEMENVLHGGAGWRKVEVNASGRVISEYGHEERPPVQGAGVVLTLDRDLQTMAMEAMAGQSGSAVMMDIIAGDILVLASAPGFDPNHFVNGIGQQEFDLLNNDQYKPLYHKSVTGTYSPGSTFKLIVALAAKQAGMPENWRVHCPGYFPFGGRNFHCWRRRGHGMVDMHTAIKASCDVFFYRAALYAGPERIAAMARAYGLGRSYDINLPGVREGIVPEPEWWRRIGRGKWTDGLTVNFGIGQGDLQATPLQLAVMAARLAANGHAVMPRLVREAPGIAQPNAAPLIAGVDPAHLEIVRNGMYGVCNEGGGTAGRAGSMIQLVRRPSDDAMVDVAEAEPGWEPVRMAGKTGTAQVRVITAAERWRGVRREEDLPWHLRDNALFVCYGPWHSPRYACAVVIEHGSHGSSAAAPIAALLMREAFLRDPARRPPARLAQLEAQGRRPA